VGLQGISNSKHIPDPLSRGESITPLLGGDKGVGNEFVYIRKTQPNLNRNSIN